MEVASDQLLDLLLCYNESFVMLWDEYAFLVVLATCSCESAKKYVEFDQQHKLLQFLMGLNECYAHVRSHILMMTPLPSVSTAFSLISQEESHRGVVSVISHHSDSPASAFYSIQDNRKNDVRCGYLIGQGTLRRFAISLLVILHDINYTNHKENLDFLSLKRMGIRKADHLARLMPRFHILMMLNYSHFILQLEIFLLLNNMQVS